MEMDIRKLKANEKIDRIIRMSRITDGKNVELRNEIRKLKQENKRLRVIPEKLINEGGDYGRTIKDYVDLALEATKYIELWIK